MSTYQDMIFACGGRIMRKFGRHALGPGLAQSDFDILTAGSVNNFSGRNLDNTWSPHAELSGAGGFRYKAVTMANADVEVDGDPDELVMCHQRNAIQSALYSADQTNGTWQVQNGCTKDSTVTSIFPGQSAQRFLNDGLFGSAGFRQSLSDVADGTEYEVLWMICESRSTADNNDETVIGIRDSGAGEWMHLAEFSWSTFDMVESSSIGTGATGSDRKQGAINLGIGPNQGRLFLLWCSCVADNPGNAMSIFCYPGGLAANSLALITHYVGFAQSTREFPSDPVITTSSVLSGEDGAIRFPLGVALEDHTQYVLMHNNGDNFGNYTGYQGSISGTGSQRFGFFSESGSTTIRALLQTTTGFARIATSFSPEMGDVVELCTQYKRDDTFFTSRDKVKFNLFSRLNGGAITFEGENRLESYGQPWSSPSAYFENGGGTVLYIIAKGVHSLEDMAALIPG